MRHMKHQLENLGDNFTGQFKCWIYYVIYGSSIHTHTERKLQHSAEDSHML